MDNIIGHKLNALVTCVCISHIKRYTYLYEQTHDDARIIKHSIAKGQFYITGNQSSDTLIYFSTFQMEIISV